MRHRSPSDFILLPMPQDPLEEWRRLTTLYSEMGDLEIQDLADQINDLTPTAQQILRDELKSRGLLNRPSPSPAPTPLSIPSPGEATVNWEPADYRYHFSDVPEEDEGPHEYTWKVALCDCETTIEAQRIALMLQRAGIDTWIERPSRSGLSGTRILVGADQVDQAQLIAAQPVSQDILDAERELEDQPEYEIPVCPKCKSPDPTLESVEPSNHWLCESCGHTWSDPIPEEAQQE